MDRQLDFMLVADLVGGIIDTEGIMVDMMNGVMDVVAGPFYYLGPDYTERREFTAARTYNPSNQFSQGMVNFAYDFTGDGWPDILMVDQRPIYLYVNPKGESRRWERYNVVPQASTEIELLKDIDGDGKPEVLFGGDGAMAYAKPLRGLCTRFQRESALALTVWASETSTAMDAWMSSTRAVGGNSRPPAPLRKPGPFMRHHSAAAARRWASTT
jgi:hypothetical protein